MNRKIILFAVMFFAVAIAWSQSKVVSRIPLIGEDAPSFTAITTNGTLEFPADYGRKWKILFSHPAVFTPVCTTEIMELAIMQKEFKDLNCELAVISTDTLERHKLWVKSMESMIYKDDKPIKIKFPLIDDSRMNIALQYGMISPSVSMRKAVRGVFIIDPDNKIEAITFYPTDIGRNLEEIKRTVIALQTAKKNTVLTPVNWKPGEDVLLHNPDSYTYYDQNKKKEDGHYDLSWYLLYKKLDK